MSQLGGAVQECHGNLTNLFIEISDRLAELLTPRIP
jgi:hypothetical protein